ncbi:MAG: hypothetical protein BWY14_00550 [Parcubacteria group bacterium ADurb.Bin192]|nr:MAG: hypothetical protein BWY14_00550 [Parcubacteria group bacterium ADurb.Bin192]
MSLNIELAKQFKRLNAGLVLDVGSKKSPYRNQIPATKYLRLDIDPKSNPDICGDIHAIPMEDNYFDTVIASEVLEHVQEPRKAVSEMHRILKPGGVCILSTRFIMPYHPDPQDYYRFSWDALRDLFKNFSQVEVHHHDNRLQCIWFFMTLSWARVILNIFNPIIARIHFMNTRCPLGFVVYAKK